MRPERETNFKVCIGYVLSSMRRHLRDRGFNAEEVEIRDALRQMVERSYGRWCIEVGVPAEVLKDERSFWGLLAWCGERSELREKLVKTDGRVGSKSREKEYSKRGLRRPKKRSKIHPGQAISTDISSCLAEISITDSTS